MLRPFNCLQVPIPKSKLAKGLRIKAVEMSFQKVWFRNNLNVLTT